MRLQQTLSNSKRSGHTLAMLVVSLSVLIGMLALVIDGGRVMQQRRQGQIAADLAALSAAVALSQSSATVSDAQTAGINSAQANGFVNNGNPCTVTVNSPPQAGTFAGKKNYVEVVIQNPQAGL